MKQKLSCLFLFQEKAREINPEMYYGWVTNIHLLIPRRPKFNIYFPIRAAE